MFKNVEEIKICKEQATVNYKINRRVTPRGKLLHVLDMEKPLSLEEKVINKTEKKKLGKENFLPKFLKKTLKVKTSIQIHIKLVKLMRRINCERWYLLCMGFHFHSTSKRF